MILSMKLSSNWFNGVALFLVKILRGCPSLVSLPVNLIDLTMALVQGQAISGPQDA